MLKKPRGLRRAIVAMVSVFSLPEDGLAARERFRFPFEFPPKSKV